MYSGKRWYLVYILDVEQNIIFPANAYDTQSFASDNLVPQPRTQTAAIVLELAEAHRYPPQIPSDLHGSMVR
jgi:hypothetical protein